MNDVPKKPRGRPSKTGPLRDAERGAIISAAFEIVREEGRGALTARAVGARVGMAFGKVYSLFADLDALRLEVNVLTMALLGRRLADALERVGKADVEVRLLCLADAYAEFAREEGSLWATLFEPRSSDVPPTFEAHVAGLFGLVEGVLRDAGHGDGDGPELLARALWSSVHGMVHLAETEGLGPIARPDTPRMVRVLVHAVVTGLGKGSRSMPTPA